MKDEYIIINKTVIEQRIEELQKFLKNPAKYGHSHEANKAELIALKQILSQSTSLIPEIEKAFDEGAVRYCDSPDGIGTFLSLSKDKQDYISNLKLDI